jgi:hypothetical protein
MNRQLVLPAGRIAGKAEPDRGECDQQRGGVAIGCLHVVENADGLRQADRVARRAPMAWIFASPETSVFQGEWS